MRQPSQQVERTPAGQPSAPVVSRPSRAESIDVHTFCPHPPSVPTAPAHRPRARRDRAPPSSSRSAAPGPRLRKRLVRAAVPLGKALAPVETDRAGFGPAVGLLTGDLAVLSTVAPETHRHGNELRMNPSPLDTITVRHRLIGPAKRKFPCGSPMKRSIPASRGTAQSQRTKHPLWFAHKPTLQSSGFEALNDNHIASAPGRSAQTPTTRQPSAGCGIG